MWGWLVWRQPPRKLPGSYQFNTQAKARTLIGIQTRSEIRDLALIRN